jgi:chorismate mutase/prephenate dehydratase
MDLGDWRSRINDLDNQILQLLNQRAEAALHIGDLKRRQGAPHYVPEREAEILHRLTALNRGPLPADAVRAVWVEILSSCRRLESPLRVAYLGPRATFTHQAALQRFGAAVDYQPSRTIAEVFDDVERGRADYGVVPVENTIEGAVNITLDRLVESPLVICGELTLEVVQNLLSQATQLTDIKRILSHPQGLAQCRRWLATHVPDVPLEDVASTALAAEMAAADPTLGAIASALAGTL